MPSSFQFTGSLKGSDWSCSMVDTSACLQSAISSVSSILKSHVASCSSTSVMSSFSYPHPFSHSNNSAIAPKNAEQLGGGRPLLKLPSSFFRYPPSNIADGRRCCGTWNAWRSNQKQAVALTLIILVKTMPAARRRRAFCGCTLTAFDSSRRSLHQSAGSHAGLPKKRRRIRAKGGRRCPPHHCRHGTVDAAEPSRGRTGLDVSCFVCDCWRGGHERDDAAEPGRQLRD